MGEEEMKWKGIAFCVFFYPYNLGIYIYVFCDMVKLDNEKVPIKCTFEEKSLNNLKFWIIINKFKPNDHVNKHSDT